MIRVLIPLTLVLIFYFIYGFYLSQSNLNIITSQIKQNTSRDFYDYRGATNVRTSNSNGSSSPIEVVHEAKKAGLDFIFLTDPNQFGDVTSLNGYTDDVLVSTENEYSFLDSRLLYYQFNNNNGFSDSSEAQLYLTDLLSKNQKENEDSFVVLAHPFRQGPTWTGAYPSGLDGIEILNPKSISDHAWMRSKLNVIWSFIIYPFNPRYAFLRLFREPVEELALLDQLSQERPTLAFGGSDASARAVPFANTLMKFPSYQTSLEITQNHVLLKSELTGQYQKDRQKILTALKRGNFYVSLDLLGDPTGFQATIEDNEKLYLSGEKVRLNKNLRLRASIPQEPNHFFEIVAFRNGERYATSNEVTLDTPIKEPGVYRVIVRVSPMLPLPEGKRWITWIYTNNFYVN